MCRPFECRWADGKRDLRARLQQLAGVGVEDVGVAPHLVDGPEAGLLDRPPVGADGQHDEVVDDVEPADGVALGRSLVGAQLAHLDGRDVAVPGEAGLRLAHRPPPVGGRRRHLDLRGPDHEVGLADLPARRVDDAGDGRPVDGLAARGAVVDPRRDARDLLGAQRDVALVVLDADVLLDVPGRHHVGLADPPGAVLDGPRPGPHVLVGQQRHRRHRLGLVAVLAAPLEDGRDVAVVGDVGLVPGPGGGRRGGHGDGGGAQAGREPASPKARCRHQDGLLAWRCDGGAACANPYRSGPVRRNQRAVAARLR